MPRRLSPFCVTETRNTPSTQPSTVPRPPPRRAPPSTTAASTSSSRPTSAFGHDLLRIVDLREAADPGHHAEPAVRDEVHRGDVDAEPPRAFGIVAEGVELPPGGGVADQDPGREHADRHDQRPEA